MPRLRLAFSTGLSTTGGGISMKEGPLSRMLKRVMVLAKLLVVATFSVGPALGTHQLSNVEKRHHELGAQRNELFAEMQELLRQQEEDVASCRAALAEVTRKVEAAKSSAGVCGNPSEVSEGAEPAAEEGQTDEIPTIVRVQHSSREEREPDEEGDRLMDDGEAADFANYFSSYAEIDHQKMMLEDDRRMQAYRDAIVNNAEVFRDKTVLDVGSGSGVLAIFAAQAGAKKVYAVEYTDMAENAKTLVEQNGFGGVIEVTQGSVESVELPEKVDVIVSEWMGYFMLRESMLDSVLFARDQWLKEDGILFPSHASMVWGIVSDEESRSRSQQDYDRSLEAWSNLVGRARSRYGLDMGALDSAYDRECRAYFVLSSQWRQLFGDQVVSKPVVVKELDLHTCRLGDSKGLNATEFSFELEADHPPVTAFAGWFVVNFRGRDGVTPLPKPLEFSTSPFAGHTHWGQQVFHLEEAVLSGEAGDPVVTIEGTVSMVRQVRNPRLYEVEVVHRKTLQGADGEKKLGDETYTVYTQD